MRLTLLPVRRDDRPAFEKRGDVLLIDGEPFDFSAVPEAAMLPADAIASDWFAGPVERIGGVLHIALLLSHGAAAPDAARFPEPVLVMKDGPLALPAHAIATETSE
jgi:hypothetical protein